MKECREELLQKKNSIIQHLQSTETYLLNEVNTNPILWDDECLKFHLTHQSTLVLKADIIVQNREERDKEQNKDRKQQLKLEQEAILLQIQKEKFQIPV